MGTSHNFTNQNEILKDVYDERTMLEQSYTGNPWMAMIEKEIGKDAGGRRYIQAVEFAHPGGANANYAKSRTNATTSLYKDFIIDRTTQHQFIQVDQSLLLAADQKSETFVKALTQFDRGFKNLGHKVGKRMYRTLGGSLGQLAIASTTTTTLTFTDNAAVFGFYINQKLTFSLTDGGGAGELDAGDTVIVTGIDHLKGTVTINTDLATKIAGVTASSYVFTDGDYGACMNGLEDWLPVLNRDARLAATFNTVVRADSAVFLGGVFRDGTGAGSTDEVMIKLGGDIGMFGGDITHSFANPQTLTDLQLVAHSKVRIDSTVSVKVKMESGELIVGFTGFRATIGDKSVLVMGDSNCPSTRLYHLEMGTWRFWYSGKFINWQGEVFGEMRIKSSRDTNDAEAQVSTYGNVGCSAPGHNGVAELNAAS